MTRITENLEGVEDNAIKISVQEDTIENNMRRINENVEGVEDNAIQIGVQSVDI